jgi:hypothetical protein
VHEEPVPLTGLSPIIEATSKAVLFKQAGPERVELVAKTAGNRRRLTAAFGVRMTSFTMFTSADSPIRSRSSTSPRATRRSTR